MNTVAVSAAVSAVVSVLVPSAFKWGGRLVRAIRSRWKPDHIPLMSGNGWSASQAATSSDQARVLVCCAPNNSLKRGQLDPDDGVAFVRQQFGNLFGDDPEFSMPGYGVRFDASGGAEHGYAWVHDSGRIDLCVHVPTPSIESGPIAIAVLDILDPVLTVLRAVQNPAYDKAFGSRRRRLRRRRFDWAVAMSPTVNIPNRGGVSWQDLVFPGRRPPRAGTGQQAYCPPTGYAAADLRDWRVRRPTSDFVAVLLRDLLQQNGFHDVTPAIDDTVAALN